ncbi:MAG: hypothetical protein ACREOZ_00080, partial [Gloeomargaritales cyanobacterium]
FRVLDLVKGDDVFKEDGTKKKGPVELHLLVLLKYLGSSGNDNTARKNGLLFGMGEGAMFDYLNRTLTAFLRLREQVMPWPNAEERLKISNRFDVTYGFPGCVGIVDGSLLPLDRKPTLDGSSYYTRKGSYSCHMQVICDDTCCI